MKDQWRLLPHDWFIHTTHCTQTSSCTTETREIVGDRERMQKQQAPSLSALFSSDQPSRVSCNTNSYDRCRLWEEEAASRKEKIGVLLRAQRGHCSLLQFQARCCCSSQCERGAKNPFFELRAQLLTRSSNVREAAQILSSLETDLNNIDTVSHTRFARPSLVEEHRLRVFVGEKLDVAQDILLGDNAQDFPVVCD